MIYLKEPGDWLIQNYWHDLRQGHRHNLLCRFPL